MVLQGGTTPQVALSIPVEGLTVTAAEADTRQAQPRIEAHTSAAARQHAARGGMNTDDCKEEVVLQNGAAAGALRGAKEEAGAAAAR